jgi:hypothetical protein
MIGGGETAASDISGRQVLGGVVGGLELHRWNVSDRSVEPVLWGCLGTTELESLIS